MWYSFMVKFSSTILTTLLTMENKDVSMSQVPIRKHGKKSFILTFYLLIRCLDTFEGSDIISVCYATR